MANLATLIGGAYGCTYDAVAIGITQDGFDLIQSLAEEVINESDFYGGSMIDYFYRGGSCQLRADSMEYKAGSILPYWPYGGGAMGIMRNASNPIGKRASDVADSIVLTSTAGTPAAAAPATLTATYAALAPGQQSTLKFTSKLRRVPLFWQLLPYDSSSNTIWYALT